MNLYSKRITLFNIKLASNKLTHHLFNLRAKIDSLSEEIRQDELAHYIATVEGAITYIPEGQSNKKFSLPLTTKKKPLSSTATKKYLEYISTLSESSKTDLLISLRDKTAAAPTELILKE